MVVSVNQAPTLDAIPDPLKIRKNSGAQTILLTGITAGGHESQVLAVTAVSGSTGLIPNPAVTYQSPNTTGTLSYTPAANQTGTALVTVKVQDNGGTAGGGIDTVTKSFTVTVVDVNEVPSFTAGADQSAAQDAGPQTVPGWATNISPGAAPDEAGQQVNFLVSVDHPELFAAPPAIAPDGTLTYAPAPNGSGTAVVTVKLHDNGGTANGGIDTSAPQTFQVAVTTYTEEAGTYNGLAQPLLTGTGAAGTPGGNELSGLLRLTSEKTGLFTGKLRLAAADFSLSGHFDKGGVAHFGQAGAAALALPRKGLPNLSLSLHLDVGWGTDKLSGTLSLSGSAVGRIDADRALYTASKNPVAPFRQVPPNLLGTYTVIFGAKTPAEQGLPGTAFPQGDGAARMTVHADGTVHIEGTLADGTQIDSINSLSKANTWPLYIPFAGGKGSISNQVNVRPQRNSDLDALNTHWYAAPDPAAVYPQGWANGILVDLIGSKFIAPVPENSASILPGLTGTNAAGNAQVSILGADIPAPGLIKAVNIRADNQIRMIAPGPDNLSLKMVKPDILDTSGGKIIVIGTSPYNGLFSGSFTDPKTGKPVSIHGAILQNQQVGLGFFLGTNESGPVSIMPK